MNGKILSSPVAGGGGGVAYVVSQPVYVESGHLLFDLSVTSSMTTTRWHK
jgi:hypothetical protein